MMKIFSLSGMILLLCGLLCSFQASANNSLHYTIDAFQTPVTYKNATNLNRFDIISVISNTDAPVSSDPTMRRGTENSEAPQGSFFVVPAFMIGLFALVLFFKEK